MQSFNIAAAVIDMARLRPDAIALAMPANSRTDKNGLPRYTEVSFGNLAAEIRSVAAGLLASGFQRGDKVVMMVPPGLDFFVLSFSMLHTGIVPVFIDPGIGLKNLRTCIAEAGPDGFIGISRAHIARVLLGWGTKTIHKTVTIGPRLFWGGKKMQSIRTPGRNADQVSFQAVASDLAAIIFTSGSTGLPKGVACTHGNFQSQLEMIRDNFGFCPGEKDMPTFPPYALFNAALGVTSIIPVMDPTKPAMVNPLHIIHPIQQLGITSMFGSPALLDVVGRYGEANGIRLPTLKRVISSGAPVSTKVIRRISSLLKPEAQIFTPYGSTEAMPVSSVGSHYLLQEASQKTDNGYGVCIGKPVAGVEVAIIRITDDYISCWSEDLKVPPGVTGEIVVKGKNVTNGYYNRDGATRLAKIPDGPAVRHRMGDIGYFDTEGTLWFCGRKTHRVSQGSKELYSIPCECIFNSHPDVFRTALVGVNGKAVLCVEAEKRNTPVDTVQLERELLSMAATHSMTKKITTILFHPGFPVDIRHNAKIIREELAVWAKNKLQ